MLTLFTATTILTVGAFLLLAILVIPSIRIIGETDVGLVSKRFSLKSLPDDNAVAFNGEAGYQAEMLMPGWRFKFWVLYGVKKFPWVQVPAGEIGVVVAQVGAPLPTGAKSGVYKPTFGNFTDLAAFVQNGGQKGVQRPVLPPGTSVPIHPIGFLVITRQKVYGLPVSHELQDLAERNHGVLTADAFGLKSDQLGLTLIRPIQVQREDKTVETYDAVGIITTLEGDPLPSGDIACRLGGFSDIEQMEAKELPDAEIIENLLGSKNVLHNNYQDFQAFLDNGGRIGLQHDPLLYGAYLLNPFLVRVEMVPMLVVHQGQVAVIKACVGLATKDTSGPGFKHGSLVKPGHRGVWQEPLRTGKYAINPRCYQAEMVPTSILTLNWAEAVSKAHNLDKHLSQIEAKSKEGFEFTLDLQVQIHVPDTMAPRVISMVGTMQNLVNEVLQAAVGNYFRQKLQSMEAVQFIQERELVQLGALDHITKHISVYDVETKGVFIQDVLLPEELVKVLQKREIAKQEIETFKMQEQAQQQRIALAETSAKADIQAELVQSEIGIKIKGNNADARKKEADGEAFYITETGRAQAAEVEAVGLAKAKGYEAQVVALGQEATALVNVVGSLSTGGNKFVPDVVVSSGAGGSTGTLDGLMALMMRKMGSPDSTAPAAAAKPTANGSLPVQQ